MVAEQTPRAIGIPGKYGFDDRPMRWFQPRVPPGSEHSNPAIAIEAVAERAIEADQPRKSAGGDQRDVIGAVQLFPDLVDQEVVGALVPAKAMMRGQNRCLPVVAAVRDRQPQRGRLNVDARLCHVTQVVRRNRRDAESALALLYDEPAAGKAGERLAQRA